MQAQIQPLLPWLREDPQGRSCGESAGLDAGAVDWQALLLTADVHRVTPLLYTRLHDCGILDRLPAEVSHALAQAYAANQARDALRWHVLEKALTALAARGIAVILLKGAALVATVYDKPAVRPMDDLDILVSPVQFRAAAQCLCDCGYRPDYAEPFPGAFQEISHHLGLTAAVPFEHTIELHHALVSLPAELAAAIPYPELLERADAVAVGAARARVLHPIDQLLHLSAHLIQHGTTAERLIWYYDLDRLVRREAGRLPWDEVLARAERYRMILPLRLALGRLVALLDTPVPPEVLVQAAAAPVDRAQRWRYEGRLRPFSRLTDGMQKVIGAGGPVASARLAWRMLFPDRAYMRATYGDHGPLRLVLSYGARWLEVGREAAVPPNLMRRT